MRLYLQQQFVRSAYYARRPADRPRACSHAGERPSKHRTSQGYVGSLGQPVSSMGVDGLNRTLKSGVNTLGEGAVTTLLPMAVA